MKGLDEKDLKILDIIKDNSKLSTQQISRKTGIPITTVHNRLKKLEKEGVIEKYTVALNYKKLGLHIQAYILITLDFSSLRKTNHSPEALFGALKKMPEVQSITTLAGQIDLMIKVVVHDIDELNNFILNKLRTLEGIDRTQTLIALESVK